MFVVGLGILLVADNSHPVNIHLVAVNIRLVVVNILLVAVDILLVAVDIRLVAVDTLHVAGEILPVADVVDTLLLVVAGILVAAEIPAAGILHAVHILVVVVHRKPVRAGVGYTQDRAVHNCSQLNNQDFGDR